jgi:hypothetical protein
MGHVPVLSNRNLVRAMAWTNLMIENSVKFWGGILPEYWLDVSS